MPNKDLAIKWFDFFHKTRALWVPVAEEYNRLEPIFLIQENCSKEDLEISKTFYFNH